MLAIVAIIDLAREAILGAQSRDHGRALQNRVGRSAEVLLKRDVDGDGVEGVDTHGALAWFASGHARYTVALAGDMRGGCSTLASSEQGYSPAPKRGRSLPV